MLAYSSAKVAITWHCCCRCILLHGPMPMEPRCYVQNLRSSVSTDRDHLSLDWLSWFQYVSINGLTRKKKHHCFDRKNRSCPQFLLFHYCLLAISQSDMNSWNFERFLAILKGIGSKPVLNFASEGVWLKISVFGKLVSSHVFCASWSCSIAELTYLSIWGPTSTTLNLPNIGAVFVGILDWSPYGIPATSHSPNVMSLLTRYCLYL